MTDKYEFCRFVGQPPTPYTDWLEWINSTPKQGVIIRAMTSADVRQPAISIKEINEFLKIQRIQNSYTSGLFRKLASLKISVELDEPISFPIKSNAIELAIRYKLESEIQEFQSALKEFFEAESKGIDVSLFKSKLKSLTFKNTL